MSITRLIPTAFALLLYFVSFSQPICGFDDVHQKLMKDSGYRKRLLKSESSLRDYISSHKELLNQKGPKTLSGPLYTIPVVVHVIHTGGAIGTIYNPSDAQIQGAIDYLNAVYNGTYPGTTGAGDLGIQFILAKRDPNCNPTNGITRTDGTVLSGYSASGVMRSSVGVDEMSVKNLVRWDPTQYYNIWVVNKIDAKDGTSGTFVAGFAYFPGAGLYDGTIMLATQMISGQKTLPHEIGHAFNLYHPFENSADPSGATCPVNGNCNTDGDQVCDTDPITLPPSFVCRTGTNSCTGTAYSNNTESNYMNYTNCYTLFTSGQRTRMLASAAGVDRISLANSLGGTAPDAGTTQCVPKINFELDNDQQSESTGATSGCRNYTDYTYHMTIGNKPSITATATLSVLSGSATEGVDFDITTNGNFSSPSKILTFPSGTDAQQSFTIRIYDDASVESTESFTLDFTVNANGGDAVKGDGKPNLSISINDNDAAPIGGTTTGTVNIGTQTAFFSVAPFTANLQSQRVQILYKASELTAAGVPAGSISGLSFLIANKLSTRAFTGLTIKLGTASVNYLYSNPTITQGSSMTTVKTLASYNTIAGWNNFVFDNAYTWDGTSNLVVEICYDNGSTSTDVADQIYLYSDGGSISQGNIFWQNNINCSQSFTSVTVQTQGYKPVIKLSYGIPATAVQTVLNSSRQEYLGPNSDIYFYDQTNNKLMARIQNSGSFDYGCTQVVLDRAGTGATQFWNNTASNYLMDKTFHVLPTTNNPGGAYTITLYYTQSEVNGWQTATGQNISNIQLVKTAGQISLVTPANPAGAGTVAIANPSIGTLGTNTTLTGSFSNGFSGFGAGIVGTVLPISLLNFDGQLKEEHVSLSWSTSSEQNSAQFDIERSFDGNQFTKTASVAAAGNSSIVSNYSFIDPGIPQENNYYRLKQIDLDGNYTYSKIILVRKSIQKIFRILDNPFKDHVDVELGEISRGSVYVRLLDVTGKEFLREINPAAGSDIVRIDLSRTNLSTGIYLLEVTFNNQKHIARIVKE